MTRTSPELPEPAQPDGGPAATEAPPSPGVGAASVPAAGPGWEGPAPDGRAAAGRAAAGRGRRLLAASRRHLGGSRPPFWLELGFIAWLCWIYDDINNLSPLRTALAYGNGHFFLHLERVLHLDPEAAMDHWLAGHHSLGWIAGNYYDNAHFVTTLGLIGLVWWRFPDRYRPLRNGLVLTNLVAMVIFWLVPTAPPRLLEPSTYIDVVGQSNSFGSWHAGTLATAANQLAAMPSMHIGWAAWSALAAWRILPQGRWRGLVWLYPALTGVVVLATGNHYLVDVVAGAAVFGGSQLLADRWQGWWTAREARRVLAAPAKGAAAGVTGAGAGVGGAGVGGAGVGGAGVGGAGVGGADRVVPE